MKLFLTQMRIDISCLLDNSAQIFALIATSITMYLLLRFGIEPDAEAKILPSFLLGAMILTLLYGTHSTFVEDNSHDRISGWHSAKLSMEWIIFSRFLAHLLCSALPLIICFFALNLLEGIAINQAFTIAYIMLQVAIFVVACGMMAAALGVSFAGSAALSHLLTLPFLFSVVIFASDAMVNAQSLNIASNAMIASDWLMLSCAIFTPISCFICAKLL